VFTLYISSTPFAPARSNQPCSLRVRCCSRSLCPLPVTYTVRLVQTQSLVGNHTCTMHRTVVMAVGSEDNQHYLTVKRIARWRHVTGRHNIHALLRGLFYGSFLGAFAKSRKATICFFISVCLSVGESSRNNWAATGRTFMEFIV
jgi:hypothetical protein